MLVKQGDRRADDSDTGRLEVWGSHTAETRAHVRTSRASEGNHKILGRTDLCAPPYPTLAAGSREQAGRGFRGGLSFK